MVDDVELLVVGFVLLVVFVLLVGGAAPPALVVSLELDPQPAATAATRASTTRAPATR